MRALRLSTACVSALAVSATMALAQMPGVYVLHSKASGGCPALDWHITVGSGNTLAGVIGWDDMKAIARVSGKLDPNTRHFQMTAKEVGGAERTATVDGQLRLDGYMTANIKGPNVNCSNVTIPYVVAGGGEGGGG